MSDRASNPSLEICQVLEQGHQGMSVTEESHTLKEAEYQPALNL